MNAMDRFYARTLETMNELRQDEWGHVGTVAGWLGEALSKEGWLYVFGTGHSHLVAEEIFYRAGGLAHAVPMLDPRVMLHENAIEATYTERETGFAAQLMEKYPVQAGDVLIVVSNSGRNAVPIEMALLGREKGMRVAAILSRRQSDAWLEMPGLPSKVGSTSSMMGLLLIQLILVQACENSLARGVAPEMYISSNTNGDDHNEKLLEKYRSRIRHL